MEDLLQQSSSALLKRRFNMDDISCEWTYPTDPAFGDLSTTIALTLSKKLKTSPQDIASVIVDSLSRDSAVSKVEMKGGGYINVWLTPAALLKGLSDTQDSLTPQGPKPSSPPVIVEYSQPNIAKPLGAHHLLSTLIGQAISNIYEHLGYTVVRWNYLGDWGTQFGKLAVAYEKWGDGRDASKYSVDELLDLYVRFHMEAESDRSLDDSAREAFLKLENGEATLQTFWEKVSETTKEELSHIYDRLHVHFEEDKGESFYEDKMDALLEEGKALKVFTEGEEGSYIVRFEESTGLPPYLVQKKDGGTLYSTRDIAQMRYRINAYHPQEILIVTDIAQKLYFEQLIETCKKLQMDLPSFENVLVGRMRYRDKGMSTRMGTSLKLEEVLSEAVKRADALIEEHRNDIQSDDHRVLSEMMGVGAVAYGILSQNRKSDVVFDWDKMLSLEGNSAPYLQYTHARARSVLRKGEIPHDFKMEMEVSSLTDLERLLVIALRKFSDVLEAARRELLPHKLAHYLYTLCQTFNSFYNADSILKAKEPHRSLRLYLTLLTADVLETGAALLTIRVPDRM